MLYKENWDETQKYLEAFWNNDYLDRCSLSIQVKKDKSKQTDFSKIYTPKERYSEPEVIDIICRSNYENTTYFAESIPAKYIDFGTAGHCEYFGCKQVYAEDTIWFDPILEEPDSSKLHTDLNNCNGYERQQNLVKKMVN